MTEVRLPIMELGDKCTELVARCLPLTSADTDPRNLHFEANGHLNVTGLGNLFEGVTVDTMTEHALGQLATLCKIPPGYLRRCPPALQKQNLDEWVPKAANDGRRVFRARASRDTGEIEAWFTRGYREYDPKDMLLDIKEECGSMKVQVLRGDVNDFTMHLQTLIPDTQWHPPADLQDRVGEIHGLGVFFGDSGIGVRGITVKMQLLRLVCTNGMIVPVDAGVGYVRRHRGNYHEIRAGLSEFWKNLGGFRDDFYHHLRDAMNKPVLPHDWDETWFEDEAKRKRFKRTWLSPGWATDGAIEVIGETMMGKYNGTLWGLTNALTEYSQHVTDGEAAVTIEEYAGRLLYGARDDAVIEVAVND